MKKTILLCIILIGAGFFFGTKIFPITQKQEKPFYFLQENNKEDKVVAITRDLEVAERIIKIYEEKNISLTLEEVFMKNEELKVNVEQFDFLIKKSNSKEEIVKIEEVVVANDDEIIKIRE